MVVHRASEHNIRCSSTAALPSIQPIPLPSPLVQARGGPVWRDFLHQFSVDYSGFSFLDTDFVSPW